jgi:hypothetical protein
VQVILYYYISVFLSNEYSELVKEGGRCDMDKVSRICPKNTTCYNIKDGAKGGRCLTDKQIEAAKNLAGMAGPKH